MQNSIPEALKSLSCTAEALPPCSPPRRAPQNGVRAVGSGAGVLGGASGLCWVEEGAVSFPVPTGAQGGWRWWWWEGHPLWLTCPNNTPSPSLLANSALSLLSCPCAPGGLSSPIFRVKESGATGHLLESNLHRIDLVHGGRTQSPSVDLVIHPSEKICSPPSSPSSPTPWKGPSVINMGARGPVLSGLEALREHPSSQGLLLTQVTDWEPGVGAASKSVAKLRPIRGDGVRVSSPFRASVSPAVKRSERTALTETPGRWSGEILTN